MADPPKVRFRAGVRGRPRADAHLSICNHWKTDSDAHMSFAAAERIQPAVNHRYPVWPRPVSDQQHVDADNQFHVRIGMYDKAVACGP